MWQHFISPAAEQDIIDILCWSELIFGEKGKKPRHIILYRKMDKKELEIARFLHDSMDLVRHLPEIYLH